MGEERRVVFNGQQFPPPAWLRDEGSSGGARCARDDQTNVQSALATQRFIQMRQRILSRQRPGKGAGGEQ